MIVIGKIWIVCEFFFEFVLKCVFLYSMFLMMNFFFVCNMIFSDLFLFVFSLLNVSKWGLVVKEGIMFVFIVIVIN